MGGFCQAKKDVQWTIAKGQYIREQDYRSIDHLRP